MISANSVLEHVANGDFSDALHELYADPARSLDDWEAAGVPRALLNLLDALAFVPAASGQALRLLQDLADTSPALEPLREYLRAAYDGVDRDRPAYDVVVRRPPPVGDFVRRLAATRVSGAVPLVVVEPYVWDWSDLLAPFAGRPCVLAFADTVARHHAALLDGVRESMLDEAHHSLVFDRYPSEAIPAIGTPNVVAASRRLIDDDTAAIIADAYRARADDPAARSGDDTPAGNWLYAIGKRIAYRRALARLGDSRAAHLANARLLAEWYDPHKGLPPPGAPLGAPLDDRIDAVSATIRARERRAGPRPSHPVRVAHVVDTLVDGTHAPTHVLRTVVEHHDRTRFEPIVISSEAFGRMSDRWPLPADPADPRRVAIVRAATVRAPETIARFRERGVPTLVHTHEGTFEESVRAFAGLLAAHEVDAAVFHGDPIFSVMAANACTMPLTVFFDHGQLPEHRGFDLVIAATHEARARHTTRLLALGSEIVSHEMVVDVLYARDCGPLDRGELGIAHDDAFVTTVSGHLELRASPEFVAAVAAVLQRIPKARYAPVGPLADAAAYVRRFEVYGVADRVTPLGPRTDVLRVLATADLYCNEFPFGSGVATLEAMATGCPVVTMYDTHGETQGFAGGMYFGPDRAVRSCDPEEYVALACHLLEDPALWDEWSRYARERYAARTDADAYVRAIERDLLDRLGVTGERVPA
ncbi:MAG: glycosyltransferase [Actinomycetota bacterium]